MGRLQARWKMIGFLCPWSENFYCFFKMKSLFGVSIVLYFIGLSAVFTFFARMLGKLLDACI
jgi:hypothetical protein